MAENVILCLDDEKIILDSLKAQLRKRFGREFMLEFAQSGEEAFEIIDDYFEEGPGVLVIVSDWLMPGMKGDEFLIRVHKKHPGIVKIMLTGEADENSIKRAYKEANLLKCLKKPWEMDELVETIKMGLKTNWERSS